MADKLIRFILSEADLRGAVVSMPDTAEILFSQHKPSPEMGEYLCNTAAAAVLLASNIHEGALSLRIAANGIIGSMNADATPDGYIRAMIAKANIEDEAIGRKLKLPMLSSGTLTVIKKLHPDKPPYQGVVEIRHPHIGPIVADYLLFSEQIRSSIAAATLFKGNLVSKCFGFYVEALPALKQEDLESMEKNVIKLGNFRDFSEKIKRPEELLEALLAGFKYDIIRETAVNFFCTCTEEKVIQAIMAAGRLEVEQIINENKEIEVFCDYCRKRYALSPELLEKNLKQ